MYLLFVPLCSVEFLIGRSFPLKAFMQLWLPADVENSGQRVYANFASCGIGNPRVGIVFRKDWFCSVQHKVATEFRTLIICYSLVSDYVAINYAFLQLSIVDCTVITNSPGLCNHIVARWRCCFVEYLEWSFKEPQPNRGDSTKLEVNVTFIIVDICSFTSIH